MRPLALALGLILVLAHLYAGVRGVCLGAWLFAVAIELLYPVMTSATDELWIYLGYDHGMWLGPITGAAGLARLLAAGGLVLALATMGRSRASAIGGGALALLCHVGVAAVFTATSVYFWDAGDRIFYEDWGPRIGELVYTLAPLRLFLTLGLTWLAVLFSLVELGLLALAAGPRESED